MLRQNAWLQPCDRQEPLRVIGRVPIGRFVQAQIVGWQQSTDTTMTIKFTVKVPAGKSAECVLRARDYGGNEVGRRTVVVRPADASATAIEADEPVTTTKRGSVGDVVGCQPAG